MVTVEREGCVIIGTIVCGPWKGRYLPVLLLLNVVGIPGIYRGSVRTHARHYYRIINLLVQRLRESWAHWIR